MTVKKEMSYWVVCDGCGESPDWDGMLTVSKSSDAAVNDALGGDWYMVGKTKHACGNCVTWDAEGEAVLLPVPAPTMATEEQE